MSKKAIVKMLKSDPSFHGDAAARARVIMEGAGDCTQCSGWSCRHCDFTGEEPFFIPSSPPRARKQQIVTETPPPPAWVKRAGPLAMRKWRENLAWRCQAASVGEQMRQVMIRDLEREATEHV